MLVHARRAFLSSFRRSCRRNSISFMNISADECEHRPLLVAINRARARRLPARPASEFQPRNLLAVSAAILPLLLKAEAATRELPRERERERERGRERAVTTLITPLDFAAAAASRVESNRIAAHRVATPATATLSHGAWRIPPRRAAAPPPSLSLSLSLSLLAAQHRRWNPRRNFRFRRGSRAR